MGRPNKHIGDVTKSVRMPKNLSLAMDKAAKERGISGNDLAVEILAAWSRKLPPGELAEDKVRKVIAYTLVDAFFDANPGLKAHIHRLMANLPQHLDESSRGKGAGRVQPSEGVSWGGEGGAKVLFAANEPPVALPTQEPVEDN